MLNINYGHNRELMEKCRRLKEYAIFVDRVRKNMETKKSLEEAIMQTIDDCIRDEILKDILIQQKAEVVQMFDQEKYEKAVKDEAFEDGKAEGYKLRLVDMVKKKLARGKTAEEIAQDLEESKETIQEIIDRI